MKIAVMGAGGQGGYLGGMLAQAGQEVTLIARGEHLRSIRRRGLVLKSDRDTVTVRPGMAADPAELGVVDLLLFCVKSYDLEEAAVSARPLVGRNTLIVPVQNGIDAWERIEASLASGVLLGGVSYLASHLSAPGEVTHGGVAGKLWLGEYRDKADDRLQEIVSLLRASGVNAEQHPQIHRLSWEKFGLVCATGGVMALLRLPIGSVITNPAVETLCRGVINEVEIVGRDSGMDLTEGMSDRLIGFIRDHIQPHTRSSMLVDLLAGRRLELEALNGAVVRMGEKAGIPTPFNLAVYAGLKPYVNGPPV
jgi:2-dehydropantoate 2-reductase